jgi:acyl-CoA thioester hydrolase
VKAASFQIRYEVHDDDVLFARAQSLLVPYDLDAGRPRRITPEERAFLTTYQEPTPAG